MSASVRVGLVLVRTYQLLLSPFAGGACRFQPSCSDTPSRRSRRTAWDEACGWRSAASRGVIRSRGRESIRCRRPAAHADRVPATSWKNASFSRSSCRSSCWRSTSRTSCRRSRRPRRRQSPAGHHDAGVRRRVPRQRTTPVERRSRRRARSSGDGDAADAITAARDVVVETDSVRAVFTTAGATLKSWKLKKYLDGAGEPLELVPVDVPGACRARSRWRPTIRRSRATLATAIYQPSAEGLSLGRCAGHADVPVPRRRSGLSAREDASTSSPTARRFVVNVEALVDVEGHRAAGHRALGPGARPRPFASMASVQLAPRAVHFRDGSVERLTADDLKETADLRGRVPVRRRRGSLLLCVAAASAARRRASSTGRSRCRSPAGRRTPRAISSRTR